MRIAMPKLLHLVLAALVLALSSEARPQETQSKEEEAKKKPIPPAQPAPPTVEEYVFVEGSLPYVPRSSTIVTKLPLERRETPNNVGLVTEPSRARAVRPGSRRRPRQREQRQYPDPERRHRLLLHPRLRLLLERPRALRRRSRARGDALPDVQRRARRSAEGARRVSLWKQSPRGRGEYRPEATAPGKALLLRGDRGLLRQL